MSLLFRIAPIALCLTVLCVAQEQQPAAPKQPPPEKMEAAIIPVKTLSGDAFNRLRNMLNVFNNARISGDEKLRTIIVYAAPEVIAEVRRVVQELDKVGSEAATGRNIELNLTFLKCSTKVSATPSPLPTDLEAVGKQLRATNLCKDVTHWDTVPLRIQEGRQTDQTAHLAGSVAPGASPVATLAIRPEAVVTRDGGRHVRFERLKINLRIPVVTTPHPQLQYNWIEVGLQTSGDFKEGQKSVLGKVSGIDDDTAVFVVVSLKVLD